MLSKILTYTSGNTTTKSAGDQTIKIFMQRFCVELTSSKCGLEKYNRSSINDNFLSSVSNDSISWLLTLFASM